MKIEFDAKRKILYLFADKESEDKIANGKVRNWFNDNGFFADRCFNKEKKIGVRIYLKRSSPNASLKERKRK